VRMLARDGGAWRSGEALASALAWGTGAAAGVLGGALLTTVGTQGAPGPGAVDASEMTVVPALAGASVALGRIAISVAAALVRGARSRRQQSAG